MALFNVSVWQRSRFTLQCFIINLVASLAWLSAVALAQFEWSEVVSRSVSIPHVALTCLGNLAVFMTAFTRGRLDMENGARDLLATTRGPKPRAINGCGLTPNDLRNDDIVIVSKDNHSYFTQLLQYTSHSHKLEARDVLPITIRPNSKLSAIDGRGLTTRPPNEVRYVDVVLLSKYNGRPHTSLKQFMQYVSHSHDLESILLQFLPFTSVQGTAEICKCDTDSNCRCVVFRATEEIMIMLARRLPRTLKRLSKSQCLLPSLICRQNGCHGCNQGLLYVEDRPDLEAAGESSKRRLREDKARVNSPDADSPDAAVCEALDNFVVEGDSSCICIPVHPWNADRWTKFMIKFLKSKEKEAKGIKVVVSDALQHYITNSAQELGLLFQTLGGCIVASEIYDSASLILPRVAEVLVNMGLTGWLRVDGFSSSLVARRAIRDYVVDSTGTGFGANAFLTEAVVFCSADGTNVCQVLCFRGGILSARRVSYMVGCVNLICSTTWCVLIAWGGNWAPSMPLSTPRVSVIIGAVGVALGMDCFEVLALFRPRARPVARDGARARAQVRFRSNIWKQRQTKAEALVRDRVRARDRAKALALARVEAQGRTPLWGLVAVVILEVVCIASLVVTLSMNKGVGRWVYSGMQVLVWVKWGIGSFLLGDKAHEDEDGSPYLFWIRKRGTWVYYSAFLLNALLAGVRSKWVYSI